MKVLTWMKIMNKPTIYCVFDCDDINPNLEDGRDHILKLKELFPQMTITYYTPMCWHGKGFTIASDYPEAEKAMHGFLHMNQSGNGECEYLCVLKYLKETLNFNWDAHGYVKLIRPPGWLITQENMRWLIDDGWTIAGHPTWYKDLDHISIDELPRHPKHPNVIIHSHISEQCGKNSISIVENFNKTINIIKFLEDNYDVKWVSSLELHKKLTF